jgi:NodT family efflux transporter outer membrane factor (OMF) lipoprotein
MLNMGQEGQGRRSAGRAGKGSGPRSLLGVIFFLLLPLAGCALGPDFVRPQPPDVQQYTSGPQPTTTIEADGKRQVLASGKTIAADWWRLFQSEPLDTMMRTALADNQDLQAAQARLRQSRDLLRVAYGSYFPAIDGNFTYSREKFSGAQFGAPSLSNLFRLYSGTVSLSYNLDFLGATRRTVEADRAQAENQFFQLQATWLTLLGNIVNTSLSRAGYLAQIKAYEEIITIEERQLKITQAKEEAGIVPLSDVLSIRARLAATRATLTPVRQSLDQTGHLLATLVGKMPSRWQPPVVRLEDFTLPEQLPLSLPSKLVRQRPDILAAEALLHAASARIGVSTAALFPSFSVSANYGQNSSVLDQFFDSVGNFWRYGGGITAPLFHGGALWFQREAAIEAYREALATYRQTVLAAFAQVADVLKALDYGAKSLKEQAVALESAKRVLQLTQENYQAGIASYLDFLNADSQYQQARIGYIQAKTQRYQNTAALFNALGGGWWNQSGEGEPSAPKEAVIPVFDRKPPAAGRNPWRGK